MIQIANTENFSENTVALLSKFVEEEYPRLIEAQWSVTYSHIMENQQIIVVLTAVIQKEKGTDSLSVIVRIAEKNYFRVQTVPANREVKRIDSKPGEFSITFLNNGREYPQRFILK